MENIITVKDLHKVFKVHKREKEGLFDAFKSLFDRKYDLVNAVDGIDFEVKRGTIHALIGVNGSGKSTTIKMLSGVLHPTSGEAKVLGFVPWKDRVEYVKSIGVLFGQKGQLSWDLPAIDTYELYRKIYNVPKQQFKEMLEDMVDTFGIKHLIKKPVRNLSLGERMKCELVCVLIHQPKLVFLDEPTIGLDLLSKDSLRKFVKRMNKDKGITFILTSHDMSDIENLCESATIIHEGKIVYNGSVAQLRVNFSDKKIINIKLKQSISKEQMNGFPLVFSDPLNAKIIVEKDTSTLPEEILKLMRELPVLDIEIQNPSMDAIIKSIYVEKMELSRQRVMSN